MLGYLVIIQCVKIVISPYTTDNKIKYLNHTLKLVTSSLQNAKVFWDLETNDLRYRIRYGRLYLDLDKDNKLIKKDGGKGLEDFDEIQRLNELKNLISENEGDKGVEEEKNNDKITDTKKENEDPIVQKKNSLLSSLVELLTKKDSSDLRSSLVEGGADKKESGLSNEPNTERKSGIQESNQREVVLDKKDSILSSAFMDPISQEYFKNMEERNNMSLLTGITEASENSKPKPKEKDKKKKKKENKSKLENKKEKIESKDGDKKKKQSESEGEKELKQKSPEPKQQESNLSEEQNENDNIAPPRPILREDFSGLIEDSRRSFLSFGDENYSKKQAKPQGKVSSNGPNIGFDFELIPIFVHKLDKKTVIMRRNMCLTHGLNFKPCIFSELWNLNPDFYWDVYKVEDTGYLRKLQNIINKKTNSNSKLKENQYAVPKDCPNSCPSGDCESTETDAGDSYSTEKPQSLQPTRQVIQRVPQMNYYAPNPPVNIPMQQTLPRIPQFNQFYSMLPMPAQAPVRTNVVPVIKPKEKILVDKDVFNKLLRERKNT